jgi:ribonuclease E
MHRAQMRAEAQAREEAARQQREARGEPAPAERPAPEAAIAEPVATTPQAAEKAAPVHAVEPRPAPQPEAPRVDTRAMLESAGLQMVETRADRVPATPPAEETVPLGRPRRERPRPGADEQLVQVETKQ